MKYAIGSLRFALDKNGAPYYQQLRIQIQQGIASGELSVGEKLPSSRLLATTLGVSRSTTTRAYDQLIAEGILISKEKRGVFVSDLPMVAHRRIASSKGKELKTKEPNSRRKHQNPPDHIETFNNQKIAKMQFDSGVDVSAFPTKEWATSMRRSWLKPDLTLLQGGYSTGYPSLKNAIVDYLYRVRGLECASKQVIVTAGNRDSLILLQHAFSTLLVSKIQTSKQKASKQPSLSWWLESPTFPPMYEVLSQKDKVHPIHIDENGPCLPHEQRSFNTNPMNIGVITPNRQYPLGIGISSQRRKEWLQKLQKPNEDWWLIEDDYDNEFIYQGRSDVPFMQTASIHERAQDRVFFIGSFSKVLFRGLRLGFIVAPISQIDLIIESQKTLSSSVSLPIQPTVADFMTYGSFDRHVNRMRRHYRMKRDFLLSLLESTLTRWFKWKRPRGGMHILIEFRAEALEAFVRQSLSGHLVSREFVSRELVSNQYLDQHIATELLKCDINLSALSSYYFDKQNVDQNTTQPEAVIKQGFLLGFSAPTETTMSTLVRTLENWLQKNL